MVGSFAAILGLSRMADRIERGHPGYNHQSGGSQALMKRVLLEIVRLDRAAAWTFVLCCLGTAQPQTHIGAEQCRGCHPLQFERHSRSSHAHSMYPAADHPMASSFFPTAQLLRKPAYHFQFSRLGKQFRVQAFDSDNVLEIPIEWAFGAGQQAVTFVTRLNEDWYLEHYYSYYTALRALGPTPGHEAIVPKTLPEAMGLPYKSLQASTGIKGCFGCHSTGPVSIGANQEIQPAELGVRCEACHGPGSLHVEAAKQRQFARARTLIERPGRLPSADLNRVCGICHRLPPTDGASIDWGYAWNVRHQPVYLSQSACFKEGALSCLACHDPHGPLQRNDAVYYDQRCRSCHGPAMLRPSPEAARKTRSARPPTAICEMRTPANCVDCHMPRVSPQAGLVFSNHWIGIYGTGEKLKPLMRGGTGGTRKDSVIP